MGESPEANEEITRTSNTVLPSISEVLPAIRTSSVNEALVSTLVVPDHEASHPVVPSGSVSIPPSATVTSGSRVRAGAGGLVSDCLAIVSLKEVRLIPLLRKNQASCWKRC